VVAGRRVRCGRDPADPRCAASWIRTCTRCAAR
jgi:hypothetical protein